MVGFTPSLSTAVWVGTDGGHPAAGEPVGWPGVRLGPAVGHLEGDDGRCARGHRRRVVPQAERDRRLRGCARPAATPAAGAGRHRRQPIRRSHRSARSSSRASKWRRASRSRSGRRPRCRVAAPPPPATAGRADSRPAAGRPERGRASPGTVTAGEPQDAPAAAAHGVAAAVGRRSCAATTTATCPAAPTFWSAALSEVVGGPVGRHALIGRQRFLTPLRVMFMIALVFLALGWSTKVAVPADRRHRRRRPAGGELGEPAGVLRAVLLRHRAALRRRVVEPGQVSRTSRVGWRRTPPASRRRSTTAPPRCATWSIRC